MARKDASPGEKEQAAIRRQKALQLRIEGNSYRTIAVELGVSFGQAHKDIRRALAELTRLEKKAATRLRQLESERLDVLHEKLKPGINDGDAKAISAAVRISERRAKLYGLDAPQQMEIGNKDDKPFKTYEGVEVDKV